MKLPFAFLAGTLCPLRLNFLFLLVGQPEAAVRESAYRIERAIKNSGYFSPIHHAAYWAR